MKYLLTQTGHLVADAYQAFGVLAPFFTDADVDDQQTETAADAYYLGQLRSDKPYTVIELLNIWGDVPERVEEHIKEMERKSYLLAVIE